MKKVVKDADAAIEGIQDGMTLLVEASDSAAYRELYCRAGTQRRKRADLYF